MFSVSIIADLMASSFEKPLSIALQYLREKLLEILFCKPMTLGLVTLSAFTFTGNINATEKYKKANNKFKNYTKVFLLNLL